MLKRYRRVKGKKRDFWVRERSSLLSFRKDVGIDIEHIIRRLYDVNSETRTILERVRSIETELRSFKAAVEAADQAARNHAALGIFR